MYSAFVAHHTVAEPKFKTVEVGSVSLKGRESVCCAPAPLSKRYFVAPEIES